MNFSSAQPARSGGAPSSVPESAGDRTLLFTGQSPLANPSTTDFSRFELQTDRNANYSLTSFLLLQGVHAGEVAGQCLEGGGEAAPALGALHGAPRCAGAPQALPTHLGRSPAFPAVQDTRRFGSWGAATAARPGQGWCCETLGLRPLPPWPGRDQTRFSRLPGPSLCWGRARTRRPKQWRVKSRLLAVQVRGVAGGN